MAILDSRLEFCDNVSVAATAGTALIGSQIDLTSTTAYPGMSDLYLVITTGDTEIITAGSAGTIAFKLASDDTASISTTTSTVHVVTSNFVTDDAAVNATGMNAGGVIFIGKLPQGAYERYLGILCVVTTTEVTAGTINAYLTNDIRQWVAFSDGIA